jgi:colanic acid/amylovoran biosynthesis glycosyltransferase
MNIGYVVVHFPVLSETFIGDELRAMAAHGHRITLIAMMPASQAGQEADRPLAKAAIRLAQISARAAIRALATPANAARAVAFVKAQTLLPRHSLLWNAAKMAGVLRLAGCSHVHAHFAGGAAAHAIVAARLAGATVSFTGHGQDIYAQPEDLPVKLQHADLAIATCVDMARDMRALAPEANVHVVPCGIDPDQFQAKHAQSNGRLLFIGRLVAQKGVDDLLHALADPDLPDGLCLDVVGDGPARAELEELAFALSISHRVRFLGAQQRDWFRAHGGAYLALVAPFKPGPKGERDTGPLVVKEAMAMGLPVLSTRFMGVKEMVLPGMGLLVEPGDRQALAKALATAARWSERERRQIGALARAHIQEHFTLKAQAEALTRLMLAARNRAGANARERQSARAQLAALLWPRSGNTL